MLSNLLNMRTAVNGEFKADILNIQRQTNSRAIMFRNSYLICKRNFLNFVLHLKYSTLYHLIDSNIKPKIAFVEIVPRNTTGKIPREKQS